MTGSETRRRDRRIEHSPPIRTLPTGVIELFDVVCEYDDGWTIHE